ncbi:hypothetical protein DV735_g4657, partial [Chaetothyriales sp. CBS 134920]
MGNSASKGAAQTAGKAIKRRQYPTSPSSSLLASQAPSPPHQHAATNPAIAIVNARDRIAQRFEDECGQAGSRKFEGRSLLSAGEIREVLGAREQGRWADAAIEKQFRLRSGVLAQILSGGVVKNV